MKNLKIILILTIISCITFSCSEDDSSTEENISKLIGTWLLTAETENGIPVQIYECDDIIIFTNTKITNNYYYGEDCDLLETYSRNYTVNNDIISITEDDETYDSKIVTLNNTTLTVQSSYEEDGETYTYTGTYTKQ